MRKTRERRHGQRKSVAASLSLVEAKFSFRAAVGDEAHHFDVLAIRLGQSLDLRISILGETEQLPASVLPHMLEALEIVKAKVSADDLSSEPED